MPESLIEYPAADTCLLYLLRHGATGPNLMNPPVIQGVGIDEGLAELGQQQAMRAADALADRPIKSVYASPMKRAMETAQIVGDKHQLTAKPVQPLVEANIGDWEGKSWPEIFEAYPKQYKAFRDNPGKNGYPGGESLIELHERVSPALQEIMLRHIGEEIVVVAHSVVNRVFLGQLLGLDYGDGYQIQQQNCAINIVRWKEGNAKVVTVNAISHLI